MNGSKWTDTKNTKNKVLRSYDEWMKWNYWIINLQDIIIAYIFGDENFPPSTWLIVLDGVGFFVVFLMEMQMHPEISQKFPPWV